jgi:hypothetical protein
MRAARHRAEAGERACRSRPTVRGGLGLASGLSCLLLASGLGADDLSRETAVFTATARQQLEEHLDDSARARGMVVCVGINPGQAPQSPNREFMAGLGSGDVVRRLSECEPRPRGAVESTTLKPAVIVTVGPIDWRSQDEAWVTVTYFRTKLQSAVRRYRVVQEQSGWVCLGQVFLDGPRL